MTKLENQPPNPKKKALRNYKLRRRYDQRSRAKAAYKYYEGLGPARRLMDVHRAFEGFGSFEMLNRMARRFKWDDRAKKHDEELQARIAGETEARTRFYTQLVQEGLEGILEKVFVRDPKTSKVTCSIEVKGWDDLLKLLRARDYLQGNTGRDPKDLAEPRNYHMAVVALIEGMKEKGYVQKPPPPGYWDADARIDPSEAAGPGGPPVEQRGT